ncbi:MAG TPA: hypothetical protein VJU61_24700 [Polyangiaceae bacterium]|nr:hypothetical protein [Polyangiaceae bacterium]
MSSIPAHLRPIARLVFVSACAFLLWRLSILGLAVAFDPFATVDILLDDAYYYLQIAYNLGHLGRSTFDGIDDSNGYQPAWMVLIGGLEALLRLEKKGLFVALQLLLLVVMVPPVWFCLRRARDPFYLGLAAGLIVSYGWFPAIYVAGLETVLFAPAFVAVAHVARQGFYENERKLSWLLAATAWIRLDAVSLVAAFAVPFAYKAWRERGLLAALLAAARFMLPAVLGLAVYALPNWLWFGSPVPLSGVAKTIGAPPFSNWGILYNYVIQTFPVLPPLAVVLVLERKYGNFVEARGSAREQNQDGRFIYAGLALLGGSLLVHYFYYAAFAGWIPWPWYFYAYALAVALLMTRLVMLCAQLGEAVFARARIVSVTALALFGLVFPALTYVLLIKQVWENQSGVTQNDGSFNRRNVADALLFAESPTPQVVAIGDRAAGLGYWSPRWIKVFALEGLVASRAYLDARRRDEGERYVRETVAPQLLVVDRETLAPLRFGGEERYVVIEPIQGRVVFDHLLVYCFPKQAVVREKHERDDQLVVLPAPATRITFDFSKAETCSGPFAEYAQNQIHSSESLRRTAVGAEYTGGFLGGTVNAVLERFDRGLALKMRALVRSLKGGG